jgi:hypothetical protein
LPEEKDQGHSWIGGWKSLSACLDVIRQEKKTRVCRIGKLVADTDWVIPAQIIAKVSPNLTIFNLQFLLALQCRFTNFKESRLHKFHPKFTFSLKAIYACSPEVTMNYFSACPLGKVYTAFPTNEHSGIDTHQQL